VDAEQGSRPPQRRIPAGLTPERALALAGVSGLLLTGLIVVVMVIGAATGDPERPVLAATTPTATPTPTPTATPKPKPTPVPLTPEQRQVRDTARQTVESKGFEVVRLRDWDPRRTLRVLIGRQTAGGKFLAFFFVKDRGYIGNDTSEASTKLRVKRVRDSIVTLTYGTPNGNRDVRYQWDGSNLSPLDQVPTVENRTAAL
jgi:hypothetical protein